MAEPFALPDYSVLTDWSPKVGDMIARNPVHPDDQWIVAADYFAANYGSG